MDKIVVNQAIKIHYKVIGAADKTALVFLHGGGGSLTAWEIMLPLFDAGKYFFITVDLRGHGLSDRPNKKSDYTLENHANDILSILDREKLEKVVLIGHCLGSMVAATFAATYPQRVEKLILINTSDRLPWLLSWGPVKKILYLFFDWIRYLFPIKKIPAKGVDYTRFIGSFDIDLRRLKADLGVMGIYVAASQAMSLIDWDSKKYFSKIKVHTLVISSTHDLLFPRGTGERIIKDISQAKLEYVNSNHISIINNPREVYHEIARFSG